MVICTQQTSQSTTIQRADALPVRLEYLDGIRGVCALYVVFCHADLIYLGLNGIPKGIASLFPVLLLAHCAVAFFIVLSGYCLMLPVARSADGKIRGGTEQFLRRRARRILPPYYAALVLSLLIAALPVFRHRIGLFGDVMFPAFLPKSILAHILLVHNFSTEYLVRIDPPMWSVAPEWQIYFLFPLAFLPLWRRFGIGALVLYAFAIGYIPHFFFAPDYNLDWTAPWYMGLFAIGMAAAVLNFSEAGNIARWRNRFPWLILPLLLFAVVAYAGIYQHAWEQKHVWLMDAAMGLGAGGLLVYCTRQTILGRPPVLVRLLTARSLLWLDGVMNLNFA